MEEKTEIKQNSIISNFVQALDEELKSQRRRSTEESINNFITCACCSFAIF